jgi:uncharacterized protein YggE
MDTFFKNSTTDPLIRISVVGVLAILALFLLVQTINGVQNFGTSTNPPTNTITVTGEGTATAIPDTATISFDATATADDVATAESKVTDTINAALASVKAAGVASADITTTSYNVSPHYTTTSCPPGIMCPSVSSTQSGYDVSENVSVKVRDTSKVGTIIGDLATANVTNVSGPDFVVADPSAVQAEARGQAIQKAQVDAKRLASQLGVSLGKVVSFSDNAGGGVVQPMFKAEGMAVSATAPAATVPVGDNEYTDDVSITYAIH